MLSSTSTSYLNTFTLLIFLVVAIVLAINVYLFNNLRVQTSVKGWELYGAIILNFLVLILSIIAFVVAIVYLVRRGETA